MGRIGRSFALVRQSFGVLMQDKELMILPLVSGTLVVLVSASFFVGMGLTGSGFTHDRPTTLAAVFVFSVVTYAIGIFFQAAVVAGATERLRGGNPTVGSALQAAASRIGPILVWAVIAATVGTILRLISERAGFIGKIVTGFLGVAWSLATFFVVPVLVLEGASVGDAFTRSAAIFKKTWGETFVGGLNLGIAAAVAWVTLVAVTGLLAWAGLGIYSLIVLLPGALLLVVLFSTLQGVFVASLYRYATTGTAGTGFDQNLMAQAFRQK